MTAMKIGEIARRSGVGVETIRYYEREALLVEPKRLPSGYRQYDESTVERLEYIRRAKELGFTLGEVRDLLELSFAAPAGCDHIQQRAERKLADIEERIRTLQQMKRSLGKIVQRCRVKNATGYCTLVHKPKRKSPQ
jgi:DNA-binding transcriptional MerR regulator